MNMKETLFTLNIVISNHSTRHTNSSSSRFTCLFLVIETKWFSYPYDKVLECEERGKWKNNKKALLVRFQHHQYWIDFHYQINWGSFYFFFFQLLCLITFNATELSMTCQKQLAECNFFPILYFSMLLG